MKCQTPFSRKNKKTVISLSTVDLHQVSLKFDFIFCGIGVSISSNGYVL